MTSIYFALFYFEFLKRKPKNKDELLCHKAPFTSSIRRICEISCSTEVKGAKSNQVVYVKSELDSHVDTVALGWNKIIMGYTGREFEVSPYKDTYESILKVPIFTGATGYISLITGQRSILIFNEALWIGDQIQHTHINPN